MKNAILAAALAAALVATAAPSHAEDIVETLPKLGNFNILTSAIRSTGLAQTLKNDGQLTMFAPSDDAFASLSIEQLVGLMNDKEKLTRVLNYHIVPGKVMATDGQYVTRNGTTVNVALRNGLTVNNARVTKFNIAADKNNIHVIDTVLFP